MRTHSHPILTACALALVIGCLTGCTPRPSTVRPSKPPEPTASPVFTSDADALAAATAAYKAYLAAMDQIAQSGGNDLNRLKPYVSREGFAHEQKEAKRLRDAQAHQTGSTAVTATRLQERSNTEISIYACQDVSQVDVLDATGSSLVDAGRPDSIPYVAVLEFNSDGRLVVMSDKFWNGDNICP